MHVYHYAPYEPTALKRLMGRHATREDEVDRLLRGGILVDLFRAVRQGLRASVESYSIKRIEPLYDFVREVPLRDAGSSIVAFEEWLQLGDGDRPSSDILDEIADYNSDDVRSTLALRDWLEKLRQELAAATGQGVPRPAEVSRSPGLDGRLGRAGAGGRRGADGRRSRRPGRAQRRAAGSVAARTAPRLAPPREQGRVLGVLPPARPRRGGPHRRQGRPRPARGRRSGRRAMAPDAAIKAAADVALPVRAPGLRHRLAVGALRPEAPSPAPRRAVEGVARQGRAARDRRQGVGRRAQLAARRRAAAPEALVPLDTFNDKEQRAALLALGEWVAANGVDADGPWRAGRDLLLRHPPRCGQAPEAASGLDGESGLDAACRLVLGPRRRARSPSRAHRAPERRTPARGWRCELLGEGKRIGISAMSHKVITNFLRRGARGGRAARSRSERRRRCPRARPARTHDRVTHVDDNADVQAGLAGGTLQRRRRARSGCGPPRRADEMVDVLFVDEAGQMSLANVLAMARSARSIVLLGDPSSSTSRSRARTRRAPIGPRWRTSSAATTRCRSTSGSSSSTRGGCTHRSRRSPRPPSTRASSRRGRTSSVSASWARSRCAAPACAWSRPTTSAPTAIAGGGAPGRGPRASARREPVDAGSTATAGSTRSRYEDVLVVAPYNAQVGAIAALLPPEARVGTVDKFQGQEAPISIYSMTSSSPEDAPRGMGFLYSRNRLNVATSRARCVAVVVAEPALLRVRARTPEQMRLANALCQFAEMAAAPLRGRVSRGRSAARRSCRRRPDERGRASQAHRAAPRCDSDSGLRIAFVEVADELAVAGVPAFLGRV